MSLKVQLVLAAATSLASAAAPPQWLCTPASYGGCFNDSAPVGRPVTQLLQPATQWLSLCSCASQCAAYNVTPYLAVTGQPGQAACYCGTSITPGAQRVSDAHCSLKCPSNSSQTCGGEGFSSLWSFSCSGPVPTPPPADPPLAPGRACSQPETRGWLWCNASAPLEARVADLVGRFTLTEIGPQLTARQAPRVPRLGTNAFYWGTNALHGVGAVQWAGGNLIYLTSCIGCPVFRLCAANNAECLNASDGSTRCATSWPQVIALASAWNATLWTAMGETTGA